MPFIRIKPAAVIFFLTAGFVFTGCETQASLTKKKVRQVEKGLLRAVYIKGSKIDKMSITGRMEFYKVPGVRIAVIDKCQVEWAKAYGYRDIRNYRPLTTKSLFQAGGLSRPLTAAAALSFAAKGGIDMDGDVASSLRSWKLPSAHVPGSQAVNRISLRDLLTHSAGLSGQVFPGYPAKDPLPDIRQVLGDLVNSLGKVLVEDQEEQAEIVNQISHLKGVIESNAPLEAIKREAMEVISAIGRIAESRQQTHHTMLGALTEKLQSMRAELSEARREMELDPLTRVYNRKAFDQHFLRTFELSKLSSQPVCLLMVDLDHFKHINDRFGHPAGDLVLKHFADCCTHTFPRRGDFVARYGGEEFAIILQETTIDAAGMLGERLLQAMRNLSLNYQGQEVRATVSIGIAELSIADDASVWLQRADSALYRAKESGRNRLVKGFNI